MIVYDKPVLRRPYSEAAAENGHLHEGKLAYLNANGEIELAGPNTAMPIGVISEPDGELTTMLGNRPGASIILFSCQSVVQVKVTGGGEYFVPGALLRVNADGLASYSDGEPGHKIVGVAVQGCTGDKAGQLVDAILCTPYVARSN